MKKIFLFLIFFASIFLFAKQSVFALGCTAIFENASPITSGTTEIYVNLTNIVTNNDEIQMQLKNVAKPTDVIRAANIRVRTNGVTLETFRFDGGTLNGQPVGSYYYDIRQGVNSWDGPLCTSNTIDYNAPSSCSDTGDCPAQGEYSLKCNKGTCDTAIGKISTDVAGFLKSIFSVLLSIAGGIAVILIIISGYRLITSQGNPEQIQHAREQLTAALVGLIFIIFSFVFLQTIGYSILRIPGFSQ